MYCIDALAPQVLSEVKVSKFVRPGTTNISLQTQLFLETNDNHFPLNPQHLALPPLPSSKTETLLAKSTLCKVSPLTMIIQTIAAKS